MSLQFDIHWFKSELSAIFSKSYELTYRYFPQGDFGALDEVAFDNEIKAGAIHFWDSGYLHIMLFDIVKNDMEINKLLDPDETSEKESEIQNLLSLI